MFNRKFKDGVQIEEKFNTKFKDEIPVGQYYIPELMLL